jgi:virginiamycin B lyase
MRPVRKILGVLGAALFAVSFAYGAVVTGTVKGPDGAPFEGAFVQAQNAKTKILVSVLSDRQGRYRVENLPAGEYRLQVRAVGFKADPRTGLNLTAGQNATYEFALQKGMVHWNDLSMYQGKTLFPDGKGKDILTGRCWACHGFETRMASVVRDEEGWKDRVTYMRESMSFFLNGYPQDPFTDQMAADVTAYMNSLFGQDSILPKSPADMPQYKDVVHPPFNDDAMNIVYVEYELPGPNRMPWSAAPDKDGNLWMPYYGRANMIGRLNPKTAEVLEFPLPHQIPAGVHSAVPAPDGSVWIDEQGTNRIGRWDPATKEITEYKDTPIDKSMGKHTVRVAPNGQIFFSGTMSSFDPETKQFTHYGGSAYGIALDPQGNAWYAAGNDLVRVDLKTREVKKWTPPSGRAKENIFNRRIQVDTDGTVWFAEYNIGKLAHFDPKTEKFVEYQLPGPDPTPYALYIGKNHELWYSSEYTDVIGRLDPKTGKVLEYPFPHSENTMREFFPDSQGRMWYATPANNKVGYFYLAGQGELASNRP